MLHPFETFSLTSKKQQELIILQVFMCDFVLLKNREENFCILKIELCYIYIVLDFLK